MLKRLVPWRIQNFLRMRNPVISAEHFLQLVGASGSRPDESQNGSTHSLNPLAAYFDAHRDGPGIWKWRHYFDIYHRHFAKFVGRQVKVLEIGIYSGGSLEMWRHYFGPLSVVHGVDIEPDCKAYETDSIRISIGDQADRNFWKEFLKEHSGFDIVIDDGGHKSHQQIPTFEELFSNLNPGGIYLCEDIDNEFNEFAYYLNRLTLALNSDDSKDDLQNLERRLATKATRFQSMVNSIHLYPFVAVIERNLHPVDEFVAPKHGSQWQPFL